MALLNPEPEQGSDRQTPLKPDRRAISARKHKRERRQRRGEKAVQNPLYRKLTIEVLEIMITKTTELEAITLLKYDELYTSLKGEKLKSLRSKIS